MPTPHPILGCALLATLGALACASPPPPLDPQLAVIASRAEGMAGELPKLAKVEGRLSQAGEPSAFAAYFSGREPVVVDEAARTPAGENARRSYYYEAGKLFYVSDDVTPPESQAGDGAKSELQLFFESGRLIGSRKLVGGKLVPLAPGEAEALTQRASALVAKAVRVRGPGYKIEFDLAKFDDLGLVGPPLRAVRYGFCIPAGEKYAAEVRGIDPSIAIGGDPTGRPRCGAGKSRAVGTTHQPAFRRVLMKLAALPYVESIQETARR